MTAKNYQLVKRGKVYQVRAYVPTDVQSAYGRKEVLRSLGTGDFARANERAVPIVDSLRAEWDELRGQAPAATPSEGELLALGLKVFRHAQQTVVQNRGERYAKDAEAYPDFVARQERKQTGLAREIAGENFDRWGGFTEQFLAREGYAVDPDEPEFEQAAAVIAEATVAAIDVENRRDRGELDAKPSSAILARAETAAEDEAKGRKNLPFKELVGAFMRQWKAGMNAAKETNTEQQKQATYKLFGGYWIDRPIRGVKAEHAAEFRDKIKLLDPNWSRKPSARKLGWDALLAEYGDRERGLSDATMNRHMAALQSLWDWAHKRGHCDGDNPFDGFHVKLRDGINTAPYVPWEPDELKALLDPPPKRSDLLEVMIVAMFTGMRLDEIASLKWGELRSEGEGEGAISYFEVVDARTPAGIRQVPVHRALGWLVSRNRGAAEERIWPKFNGEGPGKKPGADASRDFSYLKIDRGFKDRRKTFHSYRKNVTRIMERAGVPENEWAQVFGHERGFTYRTYNPDGITLQRKAEIISLIAYPGLAVPHPAEALHADG